MAMVLEGLVTTLNDDRSVQVATMGSTLDPPMTRLVLRPFPTSRTWANLKRHGQGVFHITDNVELLARAALHGVERVPAGMPASGVEGFILADACRWYAFRVAKMDQQGGRAWIDCDVVQRGWQRDFVGFNRAKHAVLEAAILATRTHLLPACEIRDEFARLATIVEKTGGDQERLAFEFLLNHVRHASQPRGDYTARG